MWKMVLNDYRYKFSCNIIGNSAVIYIILGLVVLDILGITLISDTIFLILPIIIMKYIKSIYGININRTLYLCPVNIEDRKEYIKILIFLNIIISIVLYFIIGLILLIKNNYEGCFYSCIDLYPVFFIFGMSFIICDTLDITDMITEFKYYDVITIFSKFTAIVFMIINLYFGYIQKFDSEFEYSTILSICIVIQICLTILVLIYSKKVIEFLINPERVFLAKNKSI